MPSKQELSYAKKKTARTLKENKDKKKTKGEQRTL